MTLVPMPIELGDEITAARVVDIVWAPPGAAVAAIVKVRAAVLHPV
jgi:hypothetical protein